MRGCTGDNGEHTNDAEKCSIGAGAYLLKYLAIPPWRGILPQRSNLPVRRRRRNLHWGRKHGVCKTKQTQGKVGHKGPVQTNQSAELSPPNRMPLPALLIGTEFPFFFENLTTRILPQKLAKKKLTRRSLITQDKKGGR